MSDRVHCVFRFPSLTDDQVGEVNRILGRNANLVDYKEDVEIEELLDGGNDEICALQEANISHWVRWDAGYEFDAGMLVHEAGRPTSTAAMVCIDIHGNIVVEFNESTGEAVKDELENARLYTKIYSRLFPQT